MAMIPAEIKCRVSCKGKTAAGILLIAHFAVMEKNPYDFIFGPTDVCGIAVLDKGTIIRKAEIQLSLAIMDYHPLESTFSGNISIRPMSRSSIQSAIKAFHLFNEVKQFEEGYLEKLQTALICPLLNNFGSFVVESLK